MSGERKLISDIYSREEVKIALDILSDLEEETGNSYHEPYIELLRIYQQNYTAGE